MTRIQDVLRTLTEQQQEQGGTKTLAEYLSMNLPGVQQRKPGAISVNFQESGLRQRLAF